MPWLGNPLLIKLPSLSDEASYIIEQFKAAHRDGTAWKDRAILYRNWNPVGKVISDAFTKAGIAITGHKRIEFGDKQDTVKLITFHSSKGLEFSLVAIPGVNIPGDDDKAVEEEAHLLYVAMTRATKELLVLESAS